MSTSLSLSATSAPSTSSAVTCNSSFILSFPILALCFYVTSRSAFRVAYFINLICNTIQTARIKISVFPLDKWVCPRVEQKMWKGLWVFHNILIFFLAFLPSSNSSTFSHSSSLLPPRHNHVHHYLILFLLHLLQYTNKRSVSTSL